MKKLGTVSETPFIPDVVSPLSVATSSSGKKSLIFDLRYANRHIYRGKIKFDDWKCFENYISDHKGYVKRLLPSHINKLTTP